MDGVEMSRLGIGTWSITARDGCIRMVQAGIEVGYRHMDTIRMYDNETRVGEVIETSTVPCKEVFVSTKPVKDDLSYDRVI